MEEKIEEFLHKSYGEVESKIVLDAEKRICARFKVNFNKYLDDRLLKFTHPLFESLASVTGLTQIAFLSRIVATSDYTKRDNERIATTIESEIKLIGEFHDENFEPISRPTVFAKYEALLNLRRITNSTEYSIFMQNWLITNPGMLNKAIANCLNLEEMEITIEACVTIAVMARKFHFILREEMDHVLASMIRIISVALTPMEKYAIYLREARARHSDLELVRCRKMPFHYARFKAKFTESNSRLTGFLYYTIADLINSIPCPKLIHFFGCRILHRKSKTQALLLEILNSIAINISELCEEAEKLVLNSPPELTENGLEFSKQMWIELPTIMYGEMMKIYSDESSTNYDIIDGIMNFFRANSEIEIPMNEDFLQTNSPIYNTIGKNDKLKVLNWNNLGGAE